MLNNKAFDLEKIPGIRILELIAIVGLASCGGGSSPSNPLSNTTTVSAFAAPSSVAYKGTTDITWSSAGGSTSCSSNPSGMTGAAGTYTTPQLTATTTYTVTCVGPTGSASQRVTISVAPISQASAAAAWVTEPMRAGGTVYYYCDCGTGAQAGCAVGDDNNTGTVSSAPRQHIENAAIFLRTQAAVNDTVALCKGGAFNATGTLNIGSNRCAAGTACNDLREYTPAFAHNNAKPIINNAAGSARLFSFEGDYSVGNIGGVRMLNLKLVGDGANGGTLGNGNQGIFIYNSAHDVIMANLDMDGFDMAVNNESNHGITNNIKLTGCRITNSRRIAFLGAGNNNEISYNFWDGNGGSNMFDHAIYLGSSDVVFNVQVVGNYLHGQYGPTCLGEPIVAHASIDGMLIKDNTVVLEPSQTAPTCWGMGFTNYTNSTHPIFFKNAVFSGNTIINGGNAALAITSCPGCVIENNVIIQNWAANGATGISVVENVANTGRGDPISDANVIRNNTIWFGPNATGTNTGISVYREGTGHVVANNTVSSVQTTGGFNCFNYALALISYVFINNNHCNASVVSSSWETTRGSITQWKSYSAASGFDTVSVTDAPLFTAAGTDFTPLAGSPLISNGNYKFGSSGDLTGKSRHNPPDIGALEH